MSSTFLVMDYRPRKMNYLFRYKTLIQSFLRYGHPLFHSIFLYLAIEGAFGDV